MMQPISEEKFKNLEPGDVLVTGHGNEYEVIRNSDNSPDLIVTTTYSDGTGFKPTKYNGGATFIKVVKNWKVFSLA